MSNRLGHETSPYLVQHSNNPVDWYPWGEEAIREAKRLDKPILLSIGYSACHWCHVMERESFEDHEIARLMNENFINIKVDREERPDLDSIYMKAVQSFTGHGGWPMTIFLTPHGEPFYGGTYFPPDDRFGMISFPRLLKAMADTYSKQREDVSQVASGIIERLQELNLVRHGMDLPDSDVMGRASFHLDHQLDQDNGGFGSAPKFPQPMILDFLLRFQRHSQDAEKLLQILELSLKKMASGGIYDQIGGGFHRYCVDDSWLVPHFEKMLYDNALLSRIYLHAYQVTGDEFYRRITEETLDYVLREMTSPEGGFYSTQDADSEGIEGKFFLWTKEEIEKALGSEQSEIFNAYYGVTGEGNFEGQNILHISQSLEQISLGADVNLEDLTTIIRCAKTELLKLREQRIHPARDEKILTSWNGLMVRSLAEAASVLKRDDYKEAAVNNANFITQKLQREGRLLRTFKDGHAKLNGYLEDYSFLIDGLLGVYELTFDSHWLDESHRLVKDMIELFWDEEDAVFYDTGIDHESLIVRPREVFDNAIPSGSSVATECLLKMSLVTGDATYKRYSEAMIRSMSFLVPEMALGFGRWLCVLDLYYHRPKEIAIIGPKDHIHTINLLDAVNSIYLPDKILVLSEQEVESGSEISPLLESKKRISGQPTAFVCENYVCGLPVIDRGSLLDQLTK